MNFKIGTRGSLLAKTQSTLVLNQLKKLSPQDNFELIFIKTQGDQVTDKALWQLEGKDFFTKELDEALLAEKVDFVIHSYKDLGSERPSGIELGAITKRSFPHDILLIPKERKKDLRSIDNFLIGTSSPRRIYQLKESITKFLPLKEDVEVTTKVLRGNVNTRIQKLLDGQYDAIVLAMAGLERLASYPDSREQLKALLTSLDFSILPSSHFPAAAAQGALAIEYNANAVHASQVKDLLRKIHCSQTQTLVNLERKAFNQYGGGCHLAVGINASSHNEITIEHHLGEKDETPIEKHFITNQDKLPIYQNVFIGLAGEDSSRVFYDQAYQKRPLSYQLNEAQQVIVTSNHVLNKEFLFKGSGLWCAGVKTQKHLIKKGYWVNGSSDGMGLELIQEFLNSSLMSLFFTRPSLPVILTHDKSSYSWGRTIACYKHEFTLPQPDLDQVEACYWSSYTQYQNYIKHLPFLKTKDHYCGVGKTYSLFRAANIKVTPLLSYQDLLKKVNQ